MGDGVRMGVGAEKSEKVVVGLAVGLLREWVGLEVVLVVVFMC